MKNLNWIYPEKIVAPAEIIEIAGSEVIAKMLVQRGIDTLKKAQEFLNPELLDFSDPYLFMEMEKAVNRIKEAIKNKEHIVIFGDFDCDGVTSTSLLFKTFERIGADVSYYVPDRATESHGLNSGAVCKIISGKKAKLIITCDCGTSNINEITLAKGLGTDVIITDHHEAPEIEPLALAIINPKSKRAFGEEATVEQMENLQKLAGVGVAYKLACALLKEYKKEDFKEEILYLVAIGTIADLVPMQGENRLLVKKGLEQVIKKQPQGLIKLLQIAGVNVDNGISAETIAFSVAPRINAAGRLDHAQTAVKLLTEDNVQNLEIYAKQLDMNNRTRQQLCETTFMEAEQKINRELDLKNNKAVILVDKSWHPGIIGIVASKIVEKYYRPALMIMIDEENNLARCSARSIDGLHLYNTLNKHADKLKHFGGHALAAGFSVDLSKTSLDEVVKLLNKTINEDLNAKDMQPKLFVDADINSSDLTEDFVDKINQLAPFGESNPAPIFSISNLILKQFKTMGSNNNHLKIFFSDNNNTLLEAVWWGKNSLDFNLLDKVNTAFCPRTNNFMNKVSIQMEMRDILKIENNSDNETLAVEKPVNTVVKWLDHRKKTNIQQSVQDYFKKADGKIIIFAENKEILANLNKHEEFSVRHANRQNIEKCDQIMFYDMPASEELFMAMLNKAQPKMVHLMPYNVMIDKHVDIIKTLTGMLKYAHANKNGRVNIEEIAIMLATTTNVIELCAKLLNKAEVINISSLNNMEMSFKFVQSTDLSALSSLEDYSVLIKEINKVQLFRQTLANQDISVLQKQFILQNKEEAFV